MYKWKINNLMERICLQMQNSTNSGENENLTPCLVLAYNIWEREQEGRAEFIQFLCSPIHVIRLIEHIILDIFLFFHGFAILVILRITLFDFNSCFILHKIRM